MTVIDLTSPLAVSVAAAFGKYSDVLAKAEKQVTGASHVLFNSIAKIARAEGATGEARWNAEYRDVFDAILKEKVPASAAPMLSWCKIAMIGLSNGIDVPVSLRKTVTLKSYYEKAREQVQNKGLVAKTARGAKPRKEETAPPAGNPVKPAAGKSAAAQTVEQASQQATKSAAQPVKVFTKDAFVPMLAMLLGKDEKFATDAMNAMAKNKTEFVKWVAAMNA